MGWPMNIHSPAVTASMMWVHMSRVESNRAHHPGGQYWDYWPGALISSQVTVTPLKIGHHFIKNCLLWTWSKSTAVNRCFFKLSPINEVVAMMLRKVLCSWAPCLQNLWNEWAKNGVHHATAVYQIQWYMWNRYIESTLYFYSYTVWLFCRKWHPLCLGLDVFKNFHFLNFQNFLFFYADYMQCRRKLCMIHLPDWQFYFLQAVRQLDM